MQFSFCQVGISLIVASLVVILYQGPAKKAFWSVLSAEQKRVCDDIGRERLMIYLISLALGGVVGYGALSFTSSLNDNLRVCGAAGVAMIVAYFTYQLWPKSRYMIHYLTDQQQTIAWLNYYKSMKNLYHTGFLIGLIGFSVFSKGCIEK